MIQVCYWFRPHNIHVFQNFTIKILRSIYEESKSGFQTIFQNGSVCIAAEIVNEVHNSEGQKSFINLIINVYLHKLFKLYLASFCKQFCLLTLL